MIHAFPEDFVFEQPAEFTDPFRYIPHPAVIEAARMVIARIDADDSLTGAFSEGKMLGVLVCKEGFIAAFSGNIDGRGTIEGFVPPIYDLTAPDGHFKKREAEISELNRQIEELMTSDRRLHLERELANAEQCRETELEAIKEQMSVSKRKREKIRSSCTDPGILERLILESQHEKAEFRRLKQGLNAGIDTIREQIVLLNEVTESLKKQRAVMSDQLQDWIFRQYIVHNEKGQQCSIAEIFAGQGLVPPGGTGECAAPKLLEYAYRNGLKPLAMGEFWYGKSPRTAVRTHGHFYPSCTSKCGPLLDYMLKGQDLTSGFHVDRYCEAAKPIIVYEDEDILVAEKPSGMPSVPGLDGRTSLLELLSVTSREQRESRQLHPVHRLDMDTSGIMLFAKTPEAAVNLRKQFEEHSVQKTYMARVRAHGINLPHTMGHSAKELCRSIDLPLSADYDERPRQKVDFKQGKPAHTEYRIISENSDGTADLLLFPYTGRTHQLRVHCAHTLGLGSPIVGDLLYGAHSIYDSSHEASDHHRAISQGQKASRLCLHALSITFRHPLTGERQTFTSRQLCY